MLLKKTESSVGIQTCYGRSGDRIPVEAIISVPVQIGPGAHPDSYTMDRKILPRVNQPECDVNHPLLQSSAKVKERVKLYPYSHYGPSR
jgi:hypothetical protein